MISLLVTSDEPLGVTIYDGGEYQVLCELSYTFEVVWNADEPFHFSEVLSLYFLEWWIELEVSLPASQLEMRNTVKPV